MGKLVRFPSCFIPSQNYTPAPNGEAGTFFELFYPIAKITLPRLMGKLAGTEYGRRDAGSFGELGVGIQRVMQMRKDHFPAHHFGYMMAIEVCAQKR